MIRRVGAEPQFLPQRTGQLLATGVSGYWIIMISCFKLEAYPTEI